MTAARKKARLEWCGGACSDVLTAHCAHTVNTIFPKCSDASIMR